MPENQDYISTVYQNLKQAYSNDFTKTEEEFREKLNSDFNYRRTVHSNLKQAYGESFKKDFNTFNFQLPSIASPSKKVENLPSTTVEDFDRANEELPKMASDMSRMDYTIDKTNSSMPSETTNMLGGQYRASKAFKDKIDSWQEKQHEQTSREKLSSKDPDIMKSDIQVVSNATARLAGGKAYGPEGAAYGKYLLHLKDNNPEKFNEKYEKLMNYGFDLSDKERHNEFQEALNFNASMAKNDAEVAKARGHEYRIKEYSKVVGQMNQLASEIESYGDPNALSDEKKTELKSKWDSLSQQKEKLDADPKYKDALDSYSDIEKQYDEVLRAQAKIIKDNPSVLKKMKDQADIKRQEELIAGDFKDVTPEDIKSGTFGRAKLYQGRESLSNVWNTVVDNGAGLLETLKDIGDVANSGYSVNDRIIDKLNSFTESTVKATVSETDLFDENGNMRMYRLGPNLAKVGTDMAIMLAPVGRLRQLGETAKLGKYADEAAAVSSQFIFTYDDYKKDAVAHGMSDKEASAYGLAASAATSIMAALSPNEALLNPTTIKGSLQDLAKRYASQGMISLTKKETFNKFISEAVSVIGTSSKEALKEAGQENLESIAEKAVNILANSSARRDPSYRKMDEEISKSEFLSNTILSVALTAPATAIAQSSSSSAITDGATLELLKNYDESQKILSEMKDGGKLSNEAYNRVSATLERTKELYDKIPSSYSDESKSRVIPLLREKASLDESVKRLDENFKFRDEAKLSEVNAQLKAFQEFETADPVKEETEKVGEKKPENTEKKDKPEEQKAPEFEFLTDKEIADLKDGSEVSYVEEGSIKKGIIRYKLNNGTSMVDFSGGKGKNMKIVRDKALVKEPVDLGLEDAEVEALKKQDDYEQQKQQTSSVLKPGNEAWNLAVKNRLGKVFKGTDVSFNQEEFNQAAQASEHENAINSNGFYDPKTNKIYLNPSKVKKDTPVHEFGHIWTDVLLEKNPGAYDKMLELSRQSDFYKEAKSNPNYSHLSDNDIAEESFVQALGKKGVDVFSDMANQNAFTQAMKDMWDTIKNAFGMNDFKFDENTSFTKFVELAAEDLAKNKEIKTSEKQGDQKQQIEKRDLVEESGLRKQMTEDDKGNYVFYHYSSKELKKIDPNKFGSNTQATGRDEQPGVNISMYYTRPDLQESNVPSNYGHIVRIPKGEVYPINRDPLNLYDEAKAMFEKDHPGKAFDPNKQVGYISKLAAEKGFKVTVAEWNIGKTKALRAQTTEALKAEPYNKMVGNVVKYSNEESRNFKPNAKRKDIKFQHDNEIADVARSYANSKRIKDYSIPETVKGLDNENSKKIADAFIAMKHDPQNPEVKAAYEAMATETIDQYKTLTGAGYKFEIFEGEGEPYADSKAMLKDLRDNKHLFVLSTDKEFGNNKISDSQRDENPLLRDSGHKDINGKPLLVNDVFRGVHDAFGHGKLGNGFGPIGEENAWNVHSKMYSESARRAMTTETRGQNSFVNFGPHMRNSEGAIIKKGEEGYLDAKNRPFAEQKIGLLPDWVVQGKKSYENSLTPAEKTIQDKMQKDLEENYEERKTEYLKKNGNIFDTDRARVFSPEYNNNPELLSNATQIPAREFVSKMYKEELQKEAPEGKTNSVIFTAGGSGVGKSRAAENMKLNNQITVDTNLSNFPRAVADIQEAIDHGKRVDIMFTFRDPVNSFTSKEGGVIERAKKVGRTVPYDIATEINRKALKTIIELSEHFKDNKNVSFHYFNNNFKKGEPKPISLEDVKKIKVDFEKAKENIKNEIERQYKSGELEKGSKFPVESLYAGLIGDSKRLQEFIGSGGVEQEGGRGVSERSSGDEKRGKFQFDPESESGRKVRETVAKKLEEGASEEDVVKYFKRKGLSDKMIADIMKSAKKPVQEKQKFMTNEQGSKTEQKTQEQQIKEEENRQSKMVRHSVETKDKIIAIDRIPVEDRVRAVIERVFNNDDAPRTLIAAITKRFGGDYNKALNSKRYSQEEARGLGAEIVNAFENISDAVKFAMSNGDKMDGDIQAAILDNALSAAYSLEQKGIDPELNKNLQAEIIDNIASLGEQSGRRISYYNFMYKMNPQIFAEKQVAAIANVQSKILEKKLGTASESASQRINKFASEAKSVVDDAKSKASSKAANSAYSQPKYNGPVGTKSSKDLNAIREKRNSKLEELKKKFGKNKPGEKFSFEEPNSTPIDAEKLKSIQEVGETFIDEGYLTYNQWSRKMQSALQSAGVEVYGKELQEAWGNLNNKVSQAIKEAYKNASPREVDSLIASQAKDKVKEQSDAIRSILADSNTSQESKDKIKKRLISELGLTNGYAQHIVDTFSSEFENQARKQVRSKLKSIKNKGLISTIKKNNKVAEDRIVNDVLNGTFEGEKLKPAFMEAIGLKEADTAAQDRIRELSIKVASQTENSVMKDKAMRDLYNEMRKYTPTGSWELGTDIYYNSILSGYETHLKNFVLFNAIQTYLNKPVQMMLQKGGLKSGAAYASYTKNVANFMLNEAKGVMLTGTNAFTGKPVAQSSLEQLSKSDSFLGKTLYRYAYLPTRALSAEDAFGTVGLTESKAKQILYNKRVKALQDMGEKVVHDQVMESVNKDLGYTKESIDAATAKAEESLKNYYGEDFDLQAELSGKDAKRRNTIKAEYQREIYRQIVNQRDGEVMSEAIEWSKEALLQNDPTGTMGRFYQGIQGFLNKVPATRVFIPFLKVPMNVANNLIQNAPILNLVRIASPLIHGGYGVRGQFGGGEKMTRDQYMSHVQSAITHTAITAALIALQEGLRDDDDKPFFYITGKNGKSYTDAMAREQAGYDQPYTVYVGGVPLLKYQYTPWMTIFAIPGLLNDLRIENNGSIPEDMGASVTSNVFINYLGLVNDQASMKGVNEVLKAVEEGYDEMIKGGGDKGGKFNEFVSKKSAQIAKTLLVPNIATQTNTDIKALFDQDRIASTSFMDDVIKDMPIVDVVSQQFYGNESKIDVLGRPIKEKFGIAGYQKTGDDEYYKMFVDKHYLPFGYNKRKIKVNIHDDGGVRIETIPLDAKQRYDANKMRGSMLLDYMENNFERLSEMTDSEFESTIKSKISNFDKKVEKQLFSDLETVDE
jgi:hypothetical protein